ncbi:MULTISPECIES: DUF779 domain-containing protein [Luteimonas]|uniref:DUF779 domain-containing protein n=1 Tax=Luteimonas TaxID=83614 RepID=UPI000C7D55B0|nr:MULTISPECIES: DUF779 domain-containing protein [Luteimonas]
MGRDVARVVATPVALARIDALRARHGDLLFHLAAAGEAAPPLCVAVGTFGIGARDVRLGEVGGAAFYCTPAQFEARCDTQLIVDAIDGDDDPASLHDDDGRRFVVRGRAFDADELDTLAHDAR